LKEKSKALSYIFTAVVGTSIIGILTIGLIADVAGWRSVFLIFTLPASVFAMCLAYFALPSKAVEETPYSGTKSYKVAFKQVFLNKSAAFCLIAGFLLSATGLGLYTGTYFREVFEMPRNVLSYVLATITATAMVAYIVGGRLVNRVGRKNLTVATIIASSISEMIVFLMPDMWLAVGVDVTHVFLGWIGAIAITSYVLEQVPKSRSTIMSVRSVVDNLGGVVAPAFGGVVLAVISFNLLLSYQVVGFVFGAIGILAAGIFYFLTRDLTPQVQ
jgi:predicted MFS family arabinose efflux permease